MVCQANFSPPPLPNTWQSQHAYPLAIFAFTHPQRASSANEIASAMFVSTSIVADCEPLTTRSWYPGPGQIVRD